MQDAGPPSRVPVLHNAVPFPAQLQAPPPPKGPRTSRRQLGSNGTCALWMLLGRTKRPLWSAAWCSGAVIGCRVRDPGMRGTRSSKMGLAPKQETSCSGSCWD